ncbi:MAG: DsrE family protein [Verrucomicrobiota bacterium]
MNPKLLVLVTSDPRTSARPAEAVRIAAGVGTWKKADVTLYLHGPAVLALGEWVDALVDEDNFTRYLPIVGELGRPVYVQEDAPGLAELGTPSLRHQPVSPAGLARLLADATYVMRF